MKFPPCQHVELETGIKLSYRKNKVIFCAHQGMQSEIHTNYLCICLPSQLNCELLEDTKQTPSFLQQGLPDVNVHLYHLDLVKTQTLIQ